MIKLFTVLYAILFFNIVSYGQSQKLDSQVNSFLDNDYSYKRKLSRNLKRLPCYLKTRELEVFYIFRTRAGCLSSLDCFFSELELVYDKNKFPRASLSIIDQTNQIRYSSEDYAVFCETGENSWEGLQVSQYAKKYGAKYAFRIDKVNLKVYFLPIGVEIKVLDFLMGEMRISTLEEFEDCCWLDL